MPSIVQVAPTGGVLPCLCDHGPVCWILEGGGENEDLDWRGPLPFPLWQPQTNHRDEKEAVATSVGRSVGQHLILSGSAIRSLTTAQGAQSSSSTRTQSSACIKTGILRGQAAFVSCVIEQRNFETKYATLPLGSSGVGTSCLHNL